MKKKHISTVLFILGLLIGFSVLLYPYIGAYFNSLRESRAVANYMDDVTAMDNSETQAILESAREYNKNLLYKPDRFNPTNNENIEYKSKLNTGRGIMGVLVIDKIDVRLSIYHGTDQGVLQIGLGHMQGTSLPVGGLSTHSFITGHRGVPSATLLTDLDRMEKGDTFMIYVMGDILTYKVDNIQTVEPNEMQAIKIDQDNDYCTLVTCTPYAVNTHRLLVRGYRVENFVDVDNNSIFTEVNKLNIFFVILIFLIPILPFIIVFLIIKCRKIHKQQAKKQSI